ncbi:MAG TPA: CusA/CzcA family heavy metal efflux RND transporter [Polyangia bacterium]|jgi:cobalt-zinc-cadmium resistance protein CzcA|nr:CusA/CzcA family heavy metal efflux RND transporter [Polyangia bacterium]
MLTRLVELSVQRRGVVLAIWACVLGVALLSARRLSIDAVPDVTSPQVYVLTTAPGLSPLEVERYLTLPIERAMNGVPGLSQIRSISRTAVSAITIGFNDDTDVWFARQLVTERLKLAEQEIPPGYGRPELGPVSTGLGEIYEFYLTSKRHTPMELRTMLDWIVAQRLRSVPDVVEVNGMGGEAKQYQVILDAKRLAGYKLTLRDVEAILERNNASIGGGYIEKNRESYVIRADAQFHSIEDIENTVVTSDADGTPVLVKNLAKVQIGAALRFGTVTKHGEGEIVKGTVMMLTGANSRNVVAAVKERLAEIQRELPEGVEIRSYYDRAEFIDRMLHTVFSNLAEGAGLVVVVLFLALGSFRGSVIAALAIPLAMSIALIGMVRLGVTGNLMSLGAIDFGLLVDGAIVMLEVALLEVARRRAVERDDIAGAVATAMGRAARPVTFSLLIIMLVYLPLMALEGVEGRMFKPMAVTVALALGGALLFSLTAFPALATVVLKAPKHEHDENAGVFGAAARLYRRALDRVLAKPAPAFASAVTLLGGAILLSRALGAEFVPRLDEGELSLDVRRLPSISITEAQRLGVQVENVLSHFPEVTSVVTLTGRAEVATDPVGPDEAAVRVKLRPKSEWKTAHDLDDLGEAIKEAIEREVPATFVGVSQPIEDRVNQLLAGSRADVVIKLFGEDLALLKQTADEIGRVIRDVPGRGDLRVQRVLGLPLLEITPDRGRLARYGLSADRVLEVVEASRVGRTAGTVFEQARRFDLVLFLPPSHLTAESFGELLVGTDAGQLVPLAQVATIAETEGPAVINRESLHRRVLVEVNVRGRDLVSFVHDAQARVASQVKLPAGVTVEWGGQFENFSRASGRLGLVVPVALFIIFGMLFLMFGDWRYALAVFAGVPFSLIGGISALWLRDLPFSIPAAVGFIAVSGVAVLNGVVMASEVHRRIERGDSGRLPIREAAAAVLRPVLTTALVATVGFIPMAISHAAGAEVQRPLATVVIGGILSSTILELLILPVLLWWIVGRIPPDADVEAM